MSVPIVSPEIPPADRRGGRLGDGRGEVEDVVRVVGLVHLAQALVGVSHDSRSGWM
jgi:hypothetical protein